MQYPTIFYNLFQISLHEGITNVGHVSLAGQSLAAEDWRAILNSRVGKKMFNFTRPLQITGTFENYKQNKIDKKQTLETMRI